MPVKSAVDRPMTTDEQALVVEHDRLAPWWAMRLKEKYQWWFSEVDLEDLVQACRIGLCLAAQRFRPGVARFSTWAAWWMTSSVQNEMRHHGLVSLPRNIIYDAIQGEFGEEEWQRIATLRRPFQLDYDRHNDYRSGQCSADSIPDLSPTAVEILEEKEEKQQSREAVRRALARLRPREAEAVRLTLLEGLTLEGAGRVLGVTRERVRQLRLRGLRGIRIALEAEGVTV